MQYDGTAIRNHVIEALKKEKEFFLVTSLERTGEWVLQDRKLIIPCSDAFQAMKVEEEAKKIEASVTEMTGQSFEVEALKPVKQENAGAESEKPAASPAVELVKKVFKGEIV